MPKPNESLNNAMFKDAKQTPFKTNEFVGHVNTAFREDMNPTTSIDNIDAQVYCFLINSSANSYRWHATTEGKKPINVRKTV